MVAYVCLPPANSKRCLSLPSTVVCTLTLTCEQTFTALHRLRLHRTMQSIGKSLTRNSWQCTMVHVHQPKQVWGVACAFLAVS
jgi:hypothetical protein